LQEVLQLLVDYLWLQIIVGLLCFFFEIAVHCQSVAPANQFPNFLMAGPSSYEDEDSVVPSDAAYADSLRE
jgi:hypothetical protein